MDRDDDVGQKGGAVTPCIGRRRCLETAMDLGLADPEDSDVNALLAAVSLHDKELRAGAAQDQVEVALVAGQANMGLRGDRKLASEIDQVLQQVRPDEVILVSDGAEDEQILPLLQSRAKIVHVHRSIVKQAPHLEGLYYTITRLMDDDKQAKRFVLPLAIVFVIWGLSFFLGYQNLAWGATLAVLGAWLFVHAMHWEDGLSKFMADVGSSMRRGRLAFLSTLGMIVLLAGGTLLGLQALDDYELPAGVTTNTPHLLSALVFLNEFLPYVVAALLVRITGALFDVWIREGRAGASLWAMGFGLISFGLIATALVDASVDRLEGLDYRRIVTFPRIIQLMAGIAVAMGAFVVGRYVRHTVAPRTTK